MSFDRIKKQAQESLALAERATPGPWRVDHDGRRRPDGGHVYFPSVRFYESPSHPMRGAVVINDGIEPTMEQCMATAALIAHARTALPDLAKALLAVCEALDVLEADWPTSIGRLRAAILRRLSK